MKKKIRRKKSTLLSQQRIIVGFQAVKEALFAKPQKVLKVWIKKGIKKEKFLVRFLKEKKMLRSKYKINSKNQNPKILDHSNRQYSQKIEEDSLSLLYKPSSFFDKINPHHQYIAALVKGRPLLNWDLVGTGEKQIFLALDEVKDPRNLGALLRTAWLMGVSAFFLPKRRTASLMNPSVSKAACGATEYVPIEEASLKESIKKLKEKNVKVLALSPGKGESLWNLNLPSHLLWLLGSEDKGIRGNLEHLSDFKVKIPLKTPQASLNVTAAATMALAETRRQFLLKRKT